MKKDLQDLLIILGVANAIMCGLLLGGYITNKFIEAFTEALLK